MQGHGHGEMGGKSWGARKLRRRGVAEASQFVMAMRGGVVTAMSSAV
jgi:hypothetical protein